MTDKTKLAACLRYLKETRRLLAEAQVDEEFSHRISYALDGILSAEGYIETTLHEADSTPAATSDRLAELQQLHRLWTKAVGTPDYDKKEWQEFEHALEKKLLGHQ